MAGGFAGPSDLCGVKAFIAPPPQYYEYYYEGDYPSDYRSDPKLMQIRIVGSPYTMKQEKRALGKSLRMYFFNSGPSCCPIFR